VDAKECNEVYEYLVNLLHQKFHIPLSSLEPNNWNEPLTGAVFHLTGVDLVYLFFEIEKHYQIRVDEKFLQYYGFNSICEITKVIEQSKRIYDNKAH